MSEGVLFNLENSQLKVQVSSIGCELQSIICDGVERLWQGDPEVWGQRAPLLFPIVGRLINLQYTHNGEVIDAPMHGFCMYRPFEGQQVSEDEVSFVTEADDETRKVFPFEFRFEVAYKLEGNKIVKTHIVENTGTNPMPFELGGHEAYATRLLPGEHMSDYYIQFEGLDAIEMFGMAEEDGILYLPKTVVPLEDGRLTKTPEQLGIDTIIIENVPGNVATLGCTKNNMKAKVEFPGFPYLGMWTMGGVDDPRYICIEPWTALPDGQFIPRELSERPGVITLDPGESITLAYTMEFI